MKIKELIYLFNEEFRNSNIKNVQTIPFIASAYSKVVKHLHDNFNSNEDVDIEQIKLLPITEHMKKKLIMLSREKISKHPKVAKSILIDELQKIHGIGKIKAVELVNSGVKKIQDLHNPKYFNMLNNSTKLLLELNPCKKIPHNTIKQMEKILVNAPKISVVLVGSYRRNTPTSNDIDIMIVSARVKIIDIYIEYLKNHIDEVYIYSKGNDKVSLLLKWKNSYFKADIFRADPKYQYSMLLYSTGSKTFNILQRAKAKRMGLLLNQKGIFNKDGDRLLGARSTEREYFKLLNMPWLEPHER